jgi:hypothetical protein
MARSIVITVRENSRGVAATCQVLDDGSKITSKTVTRLWGRADAKKAVDQLLVDGLFGSAAVALRDWMDQGELPF